MRHIESRSSPFPKTPFEITTRRPDGKGAREIEIVTEPRKIGEGTYGVVYEAEAMVPSEIAGGESQRVLIVIKVFKDTEERTAQETLKDTVRNYQMAQEAGLDVDTTLRILGTRNETMVMLTPQHRGGALYFSVMPQSEAARSFERIYMANEVIQAAARKIFDQAYKAYRKNIILPVDAFLFRIEFAASGRPRVVVKVGDLDNLENNLDRKPNPKTGKKPKPFSPEKLQEKNQKSARLALEIFLAYYQTRQINDPEVVNAIQSGQHGR